jgi:radical SAM protein with 4Fe4S-binding SPASM domain
MTTPPADGGTLLLESIMSRAAAMRQPVSGTFELTSRCNLGCGMCYIRHPASDRQARSRELSTGEWITIARESVDAGMVFLLLTGGEVFLRPDFFKIYDPLTTLGLHITLFTNGTLTTPEIARRLSERPPAQIEITVYGASPGTYESITAVPGSYKRCLEGIENLLTAGVKPVIKTTITKQNVRDLKAIEQMAHGWGLPFYAGWFISQRRDGVNCDIDCYRSAASDAVALETEIRPLAFQRMDATENAANSPDRSPFFCNAGANSFVMGPAGEMNICIDLPFPAARPLECGFQQAWRQLQDFALSVPPASMCHLCSLQAYCLWCPARAFTEVGNLSDPVPYLCDIARERQLRHDSRAAR